MGAIQPKLDTFSVLYSHIDFKGTWRCFTLVASVDSLRNSHCKLFWVCGLNFKNWSSNLKKAFFLSVLRGFHTLGQQGNPILWISLSTDSSAPKNMVLCFLASDFFHSTFWQYLLNTKHFEHIFVVMHLSERELWKG